MIDSLINLKRQSEFGWVCDGCPLPPFQL